MSYTPKCWEATMFQEFLFCQHFEIGEQSIVSKVLRLKEVYQHHLVVTAFVFRPEAAAAPGSVHFDVPDRQTGYKALAELNPRRQWNFVEVRCHGNVLVY